MAVIGTREIVVRVTVEGVSAEQVGEAFQVLRRAVELAIQPGPVQRAKLPRVLSGITVSVKPEQATR